MMTRFKRLIACGLALAAVATAKADNAAVQSALNKLYPGQGWEASDVADATTQVKSSLVGDSIRTHPWGDANSNKPAKLTRKKLTITGDAPHLHLRVRSYHDGKQLFDWLLRVLVNGEQLGADIRVYSNTAVDYYFPLKAYEGEGEVTLQLQNAPGGVAPSASNGGWYWEAAYWDLIEIVDVHRANYIRSASTGGQYIDTGYIHKTNTKAVFDVNVSANQHTLYAGLFGSMPQDKATNKGAWVFFPMFGGLTGTSSSKTLLSLTGSDTVQGPAFTYGQRTHAEFAGNKATWYPVGNPAAVQTLTNPKSLTDGVGTLFVFNYNTSTTEEGKSISETNSGNDRGRNCVATLYGLDLFEGETPKRQFVPAVSEKGVAGLLNVLNPNAPAFYPSVGKAPAGMTHGYSYADDDDTRHVFEGKIEEGETFGGKTAVVFSDGEISFQDGVIREQTVGALTVKGGATLKIDLVGTQCDCLAAETVAFDGATEDNPVTINVEVSGVADWANGYSVITGLDLQDDTLLDFIQITGNVPDGLIAWVSKGALILSAAPTTVISASWTNDNGDNDPTKPGNWVCRNVWGDVIPEALPSAAVTVSLDNDGTWTSWPAFFTADSTIDLKGNKLTVPNLGEGKIIDSSVTERYQLLESIESTGGQYINTHYKAKRTTRIEAYFNTGTRSGAWTAFFGVMKDNKPNNGVVVRYYSETSKLNGLFCNSDYGEAQIDVAANTDVRVTLQDGSLKVGDKTAKISTSANPCDYEIYIFARNDTDKKTADALCRQAYRLYSFKIYEGGTPVRDFVPAQRLSDGKVGLLDLANPGENEFYDDANGGNFASGAITNELSVGELHVNVASGETTVNSAVTISGGIPLVKDGAGTLTWGGGTLTASTPIVITNGVFKMGVNTANNVFGDSGVITVKGKGQYDLNQNGGTAPTVNRTFYIEGDGPNGNGAIVNNASGSDGGAFLKTVYLTGNATLGGSHRIDFRGTVGTCRLFGEGHVLTIKNNGMVAFCEGDSGCTVDRIVVDVGKFQPCSNATAPLDVKECIELKNGGRLISWHKTTTATYALTIPVVVSEGSCTVGTDQGSFSLKDVEVCEGTTLHNVSGRAATITGTLSGSGAITGANIAFSGDNACWHIDISGKTVQKANLENATANFLTGLKKVEVASVDGGGTYDLCRLLGLSETEVSQIPLVVTDAKTGRQLKNCRLMIRDNRLCLRIPCGLMVIIR